MALLITSLAMAHIMMGIWSITRPTMIRESFTPGPWATLVASRITYFMERGNKLPIITAFKVYMKIISKNQELSGGTANIQMLEINLIRNCWTLLIQNKITFKFQSLEDSSLHLNTILFMKEISIKNNNLQEREN